MFLDDNIAQLRREIWTPFTAPAAFGEPTEACTLARSPYFVTRYPKASDISSPRCLLQLSCYGFGWSQVW
jgi:hypothetical protein